MVIAFESITIIELCIISNEKKIMTICRHNGSTSWTSTDFYRVFGHEKELLGQALEGKRKINEMYKE